MDVNGSVGEMSMPRSRRLRHVRRPIACTEAVNESPMAMLTVSRSTGLDDTACPNSITSAPALKKH